MSHRIMCKALVHWLVAVAIVNVQSCSERPPEKRIWVSFVVDGDTVNLGDLYNIEFIQEGDTMKAMRQGRFVKLPILKDSVCDVMFKYKSYALLFNKIPRKTLYPDQDVQWIFGIRNRPFTNISGIVSKEELETDTLIRQLLYWQFDLQEHGDGIQIVRKIH